MSEIPLDSARLGARTEAAKVRIKVPKIRLTNILWQIKADTLAKEVQTSPTYSYQWLACAVGHVGLGLWALLLSHATWGGSPWPYFAIVVFVAAVKEAFDLYETRRVMRGHFGASLDLRNVVADALTATGYMLWGALFGAGILSHCSPWWLLPWFVGLLAPVAPWLRQKIYFQQAGLPFLFRLPEFPPRHAGAAATALVNEFVDGIPREQRHLAIIGTLGSGKTSLAVGVGTEAAFKGRVARYLTFSKLRQIGLKHEPPAPRNTKLWPWRESQVLIIDDVIDDPANPNTRGEFAAVVAGLERELRSRSVVWVLDAAPQDARAWVAAIEKAVDIPEHSVDLVELDKTADKRALVARWVEPRRVDLAGAAV